MIGAKLAHYEITSHLGTGGMGEVYQATDSKLGRSVAIKLLPEGFTHDTDRATRFEREARVLASLNHPNIAAIHGIEESGGRKFLVMELVPGETLAERIQGGPLPLDEALTIANRVLDGLEAAHEKGIIHRDLKPANIKITSEGLVKVLDFGLAKAGEADASNSSLVNSPTMSMAATNAGVILGTAAYMSPEQARGRAVDRRTDIFAFGCVLFEMLAGNRAFDGEDVADILSRILQREPDWTLLPSSVPPGITRVLRLCLEKDARKRRGTAGDVRIDIEQAKSVPATTTAAPPPRSKPLVWAIAVVAFLATGLAAAGGYFVHTRSRSADPVFLSVLPPEGEDFTTFLTDASISPDGQLIAFTTGVENVSKKLWIRPIHSPEARMVEKSEGAEAPFWSPDSRWVGFRDRASGKLKKASVEGGNPVVLGGAPYSGNRFSGTWNREGLILVGADTGRPIYRVSADGGVLEPQTKVDESRSELGHFRPFFLPDGRHFLVTVSSTDPAHRGIYAGDIDSQVLKPVLTGFSTTAMYSRSGHLLFVRDSTLWAQAFDVSSLAVSGEAQRVVDSVSFTPGNIAAPAGFSISQDGTLLYRTGASNEATQRSQFVWFDRKGSRLSLVGPPEAYLNPRLSPDGRRLAVEKAQERLATWLIDVATGAGARLTLDGRHPVWSSDGGTVMFSSPAGIFRKSATGAGREEEVSKKDNWTGQLDDWSLDGKYLIGSYVDKSTNRDIVVISIEKAAGNPGEPQFQPFAATAANEVQGQISPDGRWVAYVTDETGSSEIVVDSFPKPGNKRQVSASGGVQPKWSRDGKELLYVSLDRKLTSLPVTNKETLTFGVPAILFEMPSVRTTASGIGTRAQYDISPDGQRILINTALAVPEGPRLHVVLNWTALLDGK